MADIRTFKSYTELKNQHHEDFNKFPLGAAFSREQFDEMMKKWGLDTKNDIKEIVSIGAGCYIRKKDVKRFNELTQQFEDELELFKKDDNNVIDMLRYELGNHEYICSHDPEDTLEACGYTLEEYEKDQKLQLLFEKAKRLYFQDMAKYS